MNAAPVLLGAAAGARRRSSPSIASDRRLVDRVHRRLGRVCSHPRAVVVDAVNGHVTLRGVALAAEVDDLLCEVAEVAGVHDVTHAMEVYEEPGTVPALPDERRRGGRATAPAATWSTRARALAGAGALAAAAIIAGGSLGARGALVDQGARRDRTGA